MFRLALGILLAMPAMALADAGHGGHHHHGPKGGAYSGHAAALGEPGDPKARARTINVTMNDEMRFLPGQITVAKGETIRFVVRNAGQLRHEMTLGTIDELVEHAKVMQQNPGMTHDDPNAVTVDPGASKSILWKFTKEGSFDFGCLEPGHLESGMKGRILVR